MASRPGWSLSDGDFQSRAVILSQLFHWGCQVTVPIGLSWSLLGFTEKGSLVCSLEEACMTLKGRRHGCGCLGNRVRKEAGSELSVSPVLSTTPPPPHSPLLHSPDVQIQVPQGVASPLLFSLGLPSLHQSSSFPQSPTKPPSGHRTLLPPGCCGCHYCVPFQHSKIGLTSLPPALFLFSKIM